MDKHTKQDLISLSEQFGITFNTVEEFEHFLSSQNWVALDLSKPTPRKPIEYTGDDLEELSKYLPAEIIKEARAKGVIFNPDYHFISDKRCRHHQENFIRYKSNKRCVVCQLEAQAAVRAKRKESK